MVSLHSTSVFSPPPTPPPFFMFHSFSRLFFSFFLFRSYWPSASVSQVRQRKCHCSADLLLLSTSEGVFLLHQLYFKEPSGCSLSSPRLTLDFFIPPNARNRRAREEKIYLKLWVQTQEWSGSLFSIIWKLHLKLVLTGTREISSHPFTGFTVSSRRAMTCDGCRYITL